MAFVFIEEAGGPIRVCSKQPTAERLGLEWADLDLSGLSHPTEHYTLSSGALAELTDVIEAKALEVEQQWVADRMREADIEILKLEDGDPRGKADIASWRDYRRALRNRVTGGVIVGERPVAPA